MDSRLILVTSDGTLKDIIIGSSQDIGCEVITFATLDSPDVFTALCTQTILLLDLDTVSVDNKLLRSLRRKHSGMSILAASSRKYHPELKEAIRDDICACLGKPLDIDELIYWLDSLLNRKRRTEEDDSILGKRSIS